MDGNPNPDAQNPKLSSQKPCLHPSGLYPSTPLHTSPIQDLKRKNKAWRLTLPKIAIFPAEHAAQCASVVSDGQSQSIKMTLMRGETSLEPTFYVPPYHTQAILGDYLEYGTLAVWNSSRACFLIRWGPTSTFVHDSRYRGSLKKSL